MTGGLGSRARAGGPGAEEQGEGRGAGGPGSRAGPVLFLEVSAATWVRSL